MRGPMLIAEDNLLNLRVIQRMIERQGYGARIVSSGFESTANIRKLDEAVGRRSYIVAMAAHAMNSDRERCRQAGMGG